MTWQTCKLVSSTKNVQWCNEDQKPFFVSKNSLFCGFFRKDGMFGFLLDPSSEFYFSRSRDIKQRWRRSFEDGYFYYTCTTIRELDIYCTCTYHAALPNIYQYMNDLYNNEYIEMIHKYVINRCLLPRNTSIWFFFWNDMSVE